MENWKFKFYNSETNLVDWDSLDKLEWINDMKFVEQQKDYHGEIFVYTHTKMVVDNLLNLKEFNELNNDDKHILVASAIFHDVEKRSTSIIEDGRIKSPFHSKKGAITTNNILYKDFPTPTLTRRLICNLVRYHGYPLNILDKSDPIRTVIETSFKVKNNLLYILSKADVLGRISDDMDEQLEKLEYFKEYCITYDCFYNEKYFETTLARFNYLYDKNSYFTYIPFDETKFNVYVLSGIPGSGKDKYIKDNLNNLPVVSLDDIRRELKIKPTDKSGNGTIIQLAKEKAKTYMRKHIDFIWNATNITKQMRQQLIDLFISYGAKINIIYIEKPYLTLIQQNNNREYKVPENVVDKLINKLEFPEFEEGHEIIYIN